MKFFIDHIFICLVDMFFNRQFAQIQLRIIHTYTQKMTVSGVDNELYEKRDDFKFPVVNFPFICSNIPVATAYGVHISQLLLYYRAGGSYQDVLDRSLLLTRKLLNTGFLVVQLKSSLRKLYGHHHDLVDRNGISVSLMTTDMSHLLQTLPGSVLIHDLSPGL